jgi:dTDP-glucose 4,6-dehydratase
MLDLNHKNILITGGNGFIGSNFIEYINKHYINVNIVNIDKQGVGWREIRSIKFINNNTYTEMVRNVCDINNIGGYIDTIDYDYVFHFAAESHVDRSITNPSSFVYNNAYGTSVLLDYLLNRKSKARIICISTDEVYGHLHLNDPAFTEETFLNPRSPYSSSKAASDLIALSFQSTFGMDIIVTRCCNNFGPHQNDEKFIPTIIRNLMVGNKIPVYGQGTNIREWIHVDDHNKSILEIAETGASGKIYNIGSGTEKTNLELIREIIDILNPDATVDSSSFIEFVEDRKGHDFRYAIDTINYTREFEPMNFSEALKATVEFYKNKFTPKTS